MIERILVPLDGSELGDRGAKAAAKLARAEKGQVLLVRAVPAEAAHEKEVQPAKEQLRLRKEELIAEGVKAEAKLVRGEPASAILDEAASFKPSLLVLTTHGRTGVKRWTRGSVAERFIQRSPFPVLLVNPFAATQDLGRILVALDGSPDAASILPAVASIARAHQAEVVLLHVLESAAGRDEALRLLEHYRSSLQGVRSRSLVSTGPAAAKILDVAEEEHASLIALTTHGRSGTARWLYGSVAELVLHHATKPLLVLRTRGDGT